MTAEPLQVDDQLDECQWRAAGVPGAEVVLRVETVPEPAVFVEHSIEATAPDRVRTLDLADEAVLFEDEALLARLDNQVFLVTGSTDMNTLIPTLEAAVDAYTN